METSFDLLLWREGLADAAPVPTGCDLADWSSRLGAAGEEGGAALLADVATLHQGFSPQAIASRAGTTPGNPFAMRPATNGGWTLHRALADLRVLARMAATGGRPAFVQAPAALPSGRPDNPAGIGDGIPAPAPSSDIALTARQLRAALENDDVDADALATLLAALVEAGRRHPTLDHRTFVRAPLTVLVPAIAAIALIDFAGSTRDLWQAPLGSPELFHHIARLDSAGLGPYLSNVGRLARDSRDVGDLARIACETAPQTGRSDIMPWIVLLSRGCRRELLLEIVDDLGDADARAALAAILARTASRVPAAIDRELVMRLRDAGLDNADHTLAADAQRVIVRLAPDDRLEGIILGSIEASGGAFARAEAVFRHWLARSPDDTDLRARVVAARTGRFAPFAIAAGFGSPADRRDTRLRRRGVTPDYPRRTGERIRAVDVG